MANYTASGQVGGGGGAGQDNGTVIPTHPTFPVPGIYHIVSDAGNSKLNVNSTGVQPGSSSFGVSITEAGISASLTHGERVARDVGDQESP